MICLLALIVFSILGIFSVSYRKIALEAFDCVFRRVTFRKCTSRLDKRLKAKITGKLLKHAPRFGKLVFKHFEIISWFFTILLIASLVYTLHGAYNYTVYGNCNGEKGGFCIYDAFSQESGDEICVVQDAKEGALITPNSVPEWIPFEGNPDAKVIVVEFGCYACSFTRSYEPTVEKIVQKYSDDIKFVFIPLPEDQHYMSTEATIASKCAADQDRFYEYGSLLLSSELSLAMFEELANNLGLDVFSFNECMSGNIDFIQDLKDIGKASGVYGTPTFFVNDRVVVGPDSYKKLSKVIDAEMRSIS